MRIEITSAEYTDLLNVFHAAERLASLNIDGLGEFGKKLEQDEKKALLENIERIKKEDYSISDYGTTKNGQDGNSGK